MAHVAEFHAIRRASSAPPADRHLGKMVRSLARARGRSIYGQELPDDKRVKSVIPDPQGAARQWHARHRVVPINHMVVVSAALAARAPQIVREVYAMLLASKRATALLQPGGLDMQPFGFAACRGALQMIIDYCVQQHLIPRRLTVEELFDDTTRARVERLRNRQSGLSDRSLRFCAQRWNRVPQI